MFSLSQLGLFITASIVLIITPGPDSIYVLSRGISQGRKAGLVSAVGITLGLLVHTMFAAFGLAMVLMTSALAFAVVKFVGAVYLVYLGVKALISKNHSILKRDKIKQSMREIFVQGILSDVLNPKIALFFMAFLPQFVTPGHGPTSIQMMVLGFLFAVLGLVYLVIIAWFSGHVGDWLSQRRGAERWINRITGGVLVALGLRLAFVKK